MNRSLILGLGLICVSTTAPAAQTVETDAVFSRYVGDAAEANFYSNGVLMPVSPPLETYLNPGVLGNLTGDVKVQPYDPLQLRTQLNSSGHPTSELQEGELLFSPSAGFNTVEFKAGHTILGQTSFFAPNLISYTPAVVSDPGGLGIPFKFGTFNFVNGLFFGYATFDVTFTTYSQDPQFNGRTFSDTILYQLSGSQTFVTFRNHPNLIPLVLNGSGSVDLWGAVNSLDPLFFANPTGGITIGTAAAVPESSEWILMLSGLVVMGQFAARRRNRRSA
jgi:hypothetical protein